MKFRNLAILLLGVCLLAPPAVLASDDPLVDDIAPFKALLIQKLDDKQFTDLEKIESELRSTRARFAGGDWKLFHYYETLSAGHVITDAPIDSDWRNVIAALMEWQAQSPAFGVPSLLLANAYTSYAWFARGSGESDSVKEHTWGVFKDRLNQGAFHLNASRRLSPGNPQWYAIALRFALGLEWPLERAQTLVKDGAAIEPLYQHIYGMMAVFLLPRWYGEAGDWEQFATETAERIGGVKGSAVYNHIALRIAGQHTSKAFFETNDVTWRKLQWSFADREKLYGTGVQSLNAMCWLAGGVDDKTAARALMKRIGGQWDQSVWKRRDYFDSFNRWLEAE